MKYYVDACVWIDFLTERKNHKVLPEIIGTQTVLVSEILLFELQKYVPNTNITFLKNVEFVKTSKLQNEEALTLSRERVLPFADALHAILARDNNAILLTRDKHFLKLKDVCKIKLL